MKTKNQSMRKDFSLSATGVLALVAIAMIGCADVGGRNISLLPSSTILDPLEVPPGLSPISQDDQLTVPAATADNPEAIETASVQSIRRLEAWNRFEEYQEFKAMESGIGMDSQEYREAKLNGEGIFQVTTYETIDAGVRMRIVDEDFESAWNRLLLVLNDMGVVVGDVDQDARTIEVENVAIGTKPSLSERVGFSAYSGTVERLHVVQVSDSVLEVSPTTSLNVDVDFDSGRAFLTRLRFYLLTHYLRDPEGTTSLANAMEARKNMTRDADGNLAIQVFDSFDETWELVGRSLEASGIEVEDWDRSTGTYIISYYAIVKKEEQSFWRRKTDKVGDKEQFLVTVKEEGDSTLIIVTASEGASAEKAEVLATTIYDRIA